MYSNRSVVRFERTFIFLGTRTRTLYIYVYNFGLHSLVGSEETFFTTISVLCILQAADLCVSLALALHYSRLTVVCWLLAATHDLYRTVKSQVGLIDCPPPSLLASFLKYSFLGWGLPAVLLGLAILIQVSFTFRCSCIQSLFYESTQISLVSLLWNRYRPISTQSYMSPFIDFWGEIDDANVTRIAKFRCLSSNDFLNNACPIEPNYSFHGNLVNQSFIGKCYLVSFCPVHTRKNRSLCSPCSLRVYTKNQCKLLSCHYTTCCNRRATK